MQIPERLVTRDGKPVTSPDARERRGRRLVDDGTARAPGDRQGGSPEAGKGKWVQVSRLGNPLVNEVIIPLGQKDRFNRTTPNRDAALYGKYVVEPELAAIMNALFGVNAPETDRTDIVQAVLQGIPGLNEHKGKYAGTPVDTLKLNLGIPASATPNRFGVIGGDNAGYPNGRRLADDVVDIDLQVVAGILVGNEVPLGDGVDADSKGFLDEFPYVNTPDSGFDSNPGQFVQPAIPRFRPEADRDEEQAEGSAPEGRSPPPAEEDHDDPTQLRSRNGPGSQGAAAGVRGAVRRHGHRRAHA